MNSINTGLESHPNNVHSIKKIGMALINKAEFSLYNCNFVVENIPEETNLPLLARKFTFDDVIDFLTKMELSQYSETFKDNEIGGDTLLEADSEMLDELGVTSHLHQMKIMHLFKKELQGATTKYSNEHLSEFLRGCKLDKHTDALKDSGIDGDMILEVNGDLMKKVLKEIGITSKVDVIKITSKYKTFVSES